MSIMKNYFLLSLCIVAAACSSAPKVANNDLQVSQLTSVPSWANHPQDSYPSNQYLSAVGTGITRDAAIQEAKKQLAESFVVKVQSQTNSNSDSTFSQSTSGSASGDTSTKANRSLSLETETYLRGAEVKEISQVGSDYYALVALDKLKARSGLMMESNRLKIKLDHDLDSVESLYTTQKMNDAKADLAQYEELYGEASALGMGALVDVAPEEARLNRLDLKTRNKNANFNFAVRTIKGEDYFERDLQACINDRGGSVYSFDQAPANSHKVEISVIERPQHLDVAGWTSIRFDVTASVKRSDGKMYRIQTTQTETGRTRSAILESVSDRLSHDLCDSLFNRMSEASSQ
jgi:hypothetical protein